MGEEKKNKKTLYLVLGITLLSVLALGGVYAYFAARISTNEGAITGQTLDINGGTLTITAQRVSLSPSPTPVSDNLVPANFGVSPSEMTITEVNRALDSKCVGGGYTGCHVWKITARSTIDIPSANVKLNLSLVNVTDQDEWSYIVYTGTDNSSTTVLNKGNIITSFPNTNTTIDIHNGASLTANTSVYYYVMVYLNNINSAQNDGVTINTTDERGTYNGTVILEALGGQLKVDFLDRTTPADFFTYVRSKSATYTVSDQSSCKSYIENFYDCNSDTECITNAEQICENGTNNWGYTLKDYILNEDIPSSDYSAAGLSDVSVIENNEVTIIGYHGAATYTVSDQSACESYIKDEFYACDSDSECINNAEQICENGTNDWGDTLGNIIAQGAIPSSDYSAAGLSNVVITPAPTDVVIPSTIGGHPVTTIGNSAFSYNQLTSVEIPSSVTTIKNSAFANNQLTSVEIPNSVTTIDAGAFYRAFNSTTGATLIIDMITIPGEIFRGQNITNLVLGNHVTVISGGAFYGTLITSVEIPSNVISVGDRAFYRNALESIAIGNNNVTIGNCAFGTNPPLEEPFLSNYVCE